MTTAIDAGAFQSSLQRLDHLIQTVERFADPAARTHIREIVRALLELHAVGLDRLITCLDGASTSITEIVAREPSVAGMLLLHGLHPLGVEDRIREAINDVSPRLRSPGGTIELIGVQDGVARLRFQGHCDNCPSSTAKMTQTIEEAIFGKAPEVTTVEFEGAYWDRAAEAGRSRIALPVL